MRVSTVARSGPTHDDHLGDRAAAVADAALPAPELERVLAHTATCAACRAAVAAERAAKQWVAMLHEPLPDLELLGRLLTISPTRPVSASSRSTLRSVVWLSGASATAVVVLFVMIAAGPLGSLSGRPGPVTAPLRTTATAVSWTIPAVLRPDTSTVAAVLPAAPWLPGDGDADDRGVPRAFDVAAAPGPTPPYADDASDTIPGVSR